MTSYPKLWTSSGVATAAKVRQKKTNCLLVSLVRLWYNRNKGSDERKHVPTGTNNATEVVDAKPQENIYLVNLQYGVLALIMLGQALSVVDILAGQLAYLACNVIALYRVFALGRPLADKVKDFMCLGLTVAILVTKFL